MRIAAVVLIESPEGYLFLERYDYDRTISGLCLPGGKIDGSLYDCGIEDPHEAVIRETKEECGIDLENENLIYKGLYFAEPIINKHYLINVFYCKLTHIPSIVLNTDEMKDFRWIKDPYYLSNHLYAGTTKYSIDLCLNGKTKVPQN